MSDKTDRLRELKIDRADIESTRSGGGALALAAITLVLVVAGGGFWWWYVRNQVPVVEVATVEEVTETALAASSVLDASGYVTARRRATVSSKVTGKIVEVLIEEGLHVEEGQVLARLDDSTPRRLHALALAELAVAHGSLEETEVRLAEAKLNLRRTRELVAAEVRSQAELDTAQAEVDSLEARLALGREQVAVAEKIVDVRSQELDDTVIRSPFAGVVVSKDAQPGEMISPVSAGGGFTRTGIGTVVDMSSLEIEVDVNEAYINRVSAGQKVEATLDAYPSWKFPATVITPVPTADRQKATVRVRIAIESLDPRILPDMGVKVSFLETAAEEPAAASETPAPAWRIPAAALRRDGGATYVLVLAGEKLERRTIEAAEQRGESVRVTAGLRTGEQVVVAASEELAAGDLAKTKEKDK